MKPRAQKHANYVCFHKSILATSNIAEGAKQYVHFRCWAGLRVHTRRKTICALVERIHLIIVSREGNHAQFELLSKIFQPFNGMGYIFPHQSVYGHAKKGIMALLHFRTPLRVRVRATVSVKPRFFMMSHQ